MMLQKPAGMLLATLLLPYLLFAQTGRIMGRVVDTETGEPLPGVNVIVVGTTRGAATDIDGVYVILGVQPGVHSVRAQFIGYLDVTIDSVKVEPKAKVELNFEMPVQALEVEEALVIQAEEEHLDPPVPPAVKEEPHTGSSSNTGPNWDQILREKLDHLPRGKVVFNPPDSMQVGKRERVEMRITKNLEEEFEKGLKGTGTPQVDTIKVGTFMKARLTGDGFEIKALKEEEQVVAGSSFTEWAWDVRPLKSGTKSLSLIISIRLKLPGLGEEKKDYPVLDRNVEVKVNRIYTAKLFLQQYWQWIATVLVLPVIGWAWKTYSNNKKTRKHK